MHRILSLLLSLHMLFFTALLSPAAFTPEKLLFTATDPSSSETVQQDDSLAASISSPGAVLMEASTGTIIFEKDSHTLRHPASITKIMTLILIFDALEKGKIHMTDTVTVSEHAASMGGSQVFLEAGETQDVETMIKCISIASANDA